MWRRRTGYQPVPEVSSNHEELTIEPKDPLPDHLTPKEMEMVQTIDQVQDLGTNHCQFALPNVPTEMAIPFHDRISTFFLSMIQPSLVAVSLAAAAWLILRVRQYLLQHHHFFLDATNDLILLFPYVTAVLLFWSTAAPVRRRYLMALRPITHEMNEISTIHIHTALSDLGPAVDETLHYVQTAIQEVLKPMEPTLRTAKLLSGPLSQTLYDPSWEIPDAREIDLELVQAQGVVQLKMEELFKNKNNDMTLPADKTTPAFLRSASQFQQRIIYPTLLLMLVMQILVVYLIPDTSFITLEPNSSQVLLPMDPTHRHLAVDPNVTTWVLPPGQNEQNYFSGNNQIEDDDVPDQTMTRAPAAAAANDSAVATAGNAATENEDEVSTTNNREEETDATDDSEETDVEEEVVSSADEEGETPTNDAVDEEEPLAVGQEEESTEQSTAEISSTVYLSRMLLHVLISYLTSLIQVLLVFAISSPRMRAWVLYQFYVRRVEDQVDHMLRVNAVQVVLEQVLAVRMSRVRKRVIQILRVHQKAARGKPPLNKKNVHTARPNTDKEEFSSQNLRLWKLLKAKKK